MQFIFFIPAKNFNAATTTPKCQAHGKKISSAKPETPNYQIRVALVSFRQEVAGAAGGIKEFQPSQFPLKRFQLCLAGPFHCDRFDLFQFRFQPVQKQ